MHSTQQQYKKAWLYYYKVNNCKSSTYLSDDCICWHNEGTGPCDKARHDDDSTQLKLNWRFVYVVDGLPMRHAAFLYKKARAEAEEREVIAKKQTKENWR